MNLTVVQFRDYYWLLSELAEFCRAQGLPTSGGKVEITDRIAAHLDGRPVRRAKRPPRTGAMPTRFSPTTRIGAGWRCTSELRQFLQDHLERKITFDARLRGLIHDGQGRSLGDVIDEWQNVPSETTDIAPQFEYNRFIRAFRAAHIGGTHQQAIKAWAKWRDTPASQRPLLRDYLRALGPGAAPSGV